MTVLVVGAGYVGGAVARELAEAREHVVAVRRRPEPLGDGIEVLAADVASGFAAPPGVDRVVYAVAPDGRTDAEYERAYVTGLSAVLAATPGARVVLTSSTSVFGDGEGHVDESSPTAPQGTARFVLEGEALVRAAGGTAIRLAGIYGPGRDRLVRMVAEGTARIVPGAIGNRIHQRDCAGAIVHLLGLASPAPVYVGVDDAPVEMAEVYRWIAAELGAAEPPPGESDARSRGTQRKRCSNRLLRASGYGFRVPSYREGYAPLVAQHRRA